MIRQTPDVPGAVELADISRHIMRTEFVFSDPALKGAWHWQSPPEYDPQLGVIIPRSSWIRRDGHFLVMQAMFGIVEKN